jgi:hypothetical protein
MPRSENFKKNLRRLTKLSSEQKSDIYKVELQAIAGFKGAFGELEAAIGMLHLGHQLGWKALVIVHDKRTIKKYEDILGIQIRDYFPEEGPMAERAVGYGIAKNLSNFWKAVSGDVSIPKRRVIDD